MTPEEQLRPAPLMHNILNDTKEVKYVGLMVGGSVAIMPGETRPFFIHDLAPGFRPEPQTEEPATPSANEELAAAVDKVLKHTAKEVIDMVPTMETTLLVAVGAAEQTAKDPRKTILSAIAEEQLARADKEHADADAAAKAALTAGGASGSNT